MRLTFLSGAVLILIFFFGLRPKDFNFSNSISRIENPAGIRFEKYSVAFTEAIEEFRKDNRIWENGFSVEIALRPLNYKEGFNFIFLLHNGDDRNQLLLGQWHSWIIAMMDDDYDHKRGVERISVNSTSMSPAIQFITLTTGKDGTNVYFNGRRVKSNRDLTLCIPYGDRTRLILGNSQNGKNSWRGEIYGLAFWGHILTAQDAAQHFERWSEDRNFSFAKKGKPFLLYYFDEKEGAKAYDHAGGNHHLNIPSRMPVLDKEILSAPWNGFRLDKKGIEDISLNIAGFIPLGFALTLTLFGTNGAFKKKAVYTTLFVCVLVSLIIETAQAWMPSRSSSQLDLMCNTAGSIIGIVIALWMSRKGKRLKLKRDKLEIMNF